MTLGRVMILLLVIMAASAVIYVVIEAGNNVPDGLGLVGVVLGALGLTLAMLGLWLRQRESRPPR